MNISSPHADVFSDQFLLDQTRLRQLTDYAKHTLKSYRYRFPIVHIIPRTNVRQKLPKFTTIHSNMVWACQHILHNFQTCSGVSRVNLMSLSKHGANSVVPACIDTVSYTHLTLPTNREV